MKGGTTGGTGGGTAGGAMAWLMAVQVSARDQLDLHLLSALYLDLLSLGYLPYLFGLLSVTGWSLHLSALAQGSEVVVPT